MTIVVLLTELPSGERITTK